MTDLGAILFRALGYTNRRVATRAGAVRVFDGPSRGNLPTIALIHGLSGDAVGYLPLLQRLRRHARVVAIDLPGHGGSESAVDITLASCVSGGVEALASYLTEPAIVFGNSLGGLTALRFAIAHPERVRGVFVASPAGAPSTPAELDALLAKFAIHSPADAIRFLELLLHAKPGPLRHLIARDLVKRHRASPLRALLRDVPNAKPFEPAELARLDRIPTYFLWGRSERILPPSHLEFFRKNLPNATFEEPYGLGHSPHLDSVTDTTRRVIAFARDH